MLSRNIEILLLHYTIKMKNIEYVGYGSVWDRHQRYIVIFLASKLFNFAPSLLFLRISDNFSTGPEYVMRTSTRAQGARTLPLLLASLIFSQRILHFIITRTSTLSSSSFTDFLIYLLAAFGDLGYIF